jgi:hypothetical protein
MDDSEWERFFVTSVSILGSGKPNAPESVSWCSWTTFRRLNEDAGYWTCGLPDKDDVAASHIKDGGTWGQPFLYSDLAHVIIPREFSWETSPGFGYSSGSRKQNISALSQKLKEMRINHRMTGLILEIKLF